MYASTSTCRYLSLFSLLEVRFNIALFVNFENNGKSLHFIINPEQRIGLSFINNNFQFIFNIRQHVGHNLYTIFKLKVKQFKNFINCYEKNILLHLFVQNGSDFLFQPFYSIYRNYYLFTYCASKTYIHSNIGYTHLNIYNCEFNRISIYIIAFTIHRNTRSHTFVE